MKSKNPKASLSLLRKEVEAVSIAKQCELIEVRMNGYRVTSSGSFGPTFPSRGRLLLSARREQILRRALPRLLRMTGLFHYHVILHSRATLHFRVILSGTSEASEVEESERRSFGSRRVALQRESSLRMTEE